MSINVSLEDVKKASERIKKYARRTPLEKSYYYSNVSGGNVRFKLENLQVTGSFKVRGALNAIGQLTDEAFEKGVVTVSAGNHALGFGFACDAFGRKGRIVLPRSASPAKVQSLKQFTSTVEYCGETYDEAEAHTISEVREKGSHFVSPYNDPDIIAGAGTVGLEILEDFSDVDTVLVPVGGGGLLAGVALTVKSIKPEITVYGVQTEASPSSKASLDAGIITDVELFDSIADGLHGNIEKGSITFDIMKEYVEDILLVSEDEIKSEFAPYIQNHHNILEGSAVVIPAVLRRNKTMFKGKNIAGVLSGANIDIHLLAKVIAEFGDRH